MYDTKEGMSRNASLCDTNESLQAKIDSYEEVFRRLLDERPNRDTRDRLNELEPPPRYNHHRETLAGDYSQKENGPSSSNDSIPAQDPSLDNDSACHPNRSPFARQDTHLGREPFPRYDPHVERRSVGYDPNDGRISGRQQGWHPILVVRQAQGIETGRSSKKSQEDQFWPAYRRSLVSHVAL